jgi:predicted DNA-binding transcriptional regulator AlpA
MKNTSPQNSPFLTKAAAAAYLGIAQRTLDDWRTAQAIPCIERPGYVRFLQSDLDAFIQRHRVAARTAGAYRPRGRKGSNPQS